MRDKLINEQFVETKEDFLAPYYHEDDQHENKMAK